MPRNYKDEYKKFQSSPCAIKKRAKLNKINRDKGTYGNGDKKDNSHVKKDDGTVVIIVKSEGSNRGSKNDMPGDSRARGVMSNGGTIPKGGPVKGGTSALPLGPVGALFGFGKFLDKKQVGQKSMKHQKSTRFRGRKAEEGAMVYKDNPNAPKAGAGLSYSRGFDYHGGGPYYGQSAGAGAVGGSLYGAGSGSGDGTGSGRDDGGGGSDKRKDAKMKEKSGTTTNEKRALRRMKKSLRKARRQNMGDPNAPHVTAAADELAEMQLAIQNDTFTAVDNVKPWYKSKKGWEKDSFNRINSAEKQKKKWEKDNPDKSWTELGGDDPSDQGFQPRFQYHKGYTKTGSKVTTTGSGDTGLERGQWSSWARMS
jgi:hypothetical protein